MVSVHVLNIYPLNTRSANLNLFRGTKRDSHPAHRIHLANKQQVLCSSRGASLPRDQGREETDAPGQLLCRRALHSLSGQGSPLTCVGANTSLELGQELDMAVSA